MLPTRTLIIFYGLKNYRCTECTELNKDLLQGKLYLATTI